VDFFALYIIPTDDWYIVPYAEIGKRYATPHFTPGSRRPKYGQYLEAWHSLAEPAEREQKRDRDSCLPRTRGDSERRTDSCAGREGYVPGENDVPGAFQG
jgi:hypothetical protein